MLYYYIMKNGPDFDPETQRLLDQVCEGIEVPTETPSLERVGHLPTTPFLAEYTLDDDCGSYADEAWHDAQEYPEW